MYLSNRLVDWTIYDITRSMTFCTRCGSAKSFQETIADAMDGANTLITNLGRTALVLGLRALNLPQGSGVLIPAILCPTVAHAIIRAGHTPVIVDTNDDLHIAPEAISAESLKGARVIIVPHLYGMSAPIRSLLDWATANRLLVIDDAAQAAGISVDGKPLGTFGEMGILSFGPAKSIASTRGGALVSRNAHLVNQCKEYLEQPEGIHSALRRISVCLAKQRFPRTIRSLRRSIAETKRRGKDLAPDLEFQMSAFAADALAGLNPLECEIAKHLLCRSESILEIRRRTAGRIYQLLQAHTALEPIGAANTPFMSIPVRLKNNMMAEEAVDRLRKNKIEAARIYQPLQLYPQFSGYAHQPLDQSMESWNKVFLLPNPIRRNLSGVLNRLSKGLKIVEISPFESERTLSIESFPCHRL